MNILVAYDGSEQAKAAIDDLRHAGMPGSANALVVSVGEPLLAATAKVDVAPEAMTHRVAGTLAQARAAAAQVIRDTRRLTRDASRQIHQLFPEWGVYVKTSSGVAADVLIQRAEDWRADLIVVGSHSRSALGRFVLGSVSTRVAIEAHCSVRVAREVRERAARPIHIVLGVDGCADSRDPDVLRLCFRAQRPLHD